MTRTNRASFVAAAMLTGAVLCSSGCVAPEEEQGSSVGAATEKRPMTFAELVDRYDGAELPGCGTLDLCWYQKSADPDNVPDQCTKERPENYEQESLDLKIDSEDETKKVWLAVNVAENLQQQVNPDGSEMVTYTEEYPKSMPPGPGQDAGFMSRYTLTIVARDGKVVDFELYQEDFDPMTREWGPWFDIRYETDNPVVCGS